MLVVIDSSTTQEHKRMMERDLNFWCGNCRYKPRTQRGVVKTSLDCFLDGHRLHFLFKRAGTCSTGSHNAPDVVVERANDMLNGNDFGKYHLFENNCECFAFYCKTGNRTSLQVFSIKSAAKIAIEAMVKLKLERLGHDFSVHHKES